MSEPDSVITETLTSDSEKIQPGTETPKKAPRSEAQMAALHKARDKAMAIRSQNAELKRKQVEIDRAVAAKAKREEAERIEREYAAMQEPTEPKKRKRKPARKVIVTEASSASESEEEVEVVLPKSKTTAADRLYQRTMSKLFEFQ